MPSYSKRTNVSTPTTRLEAVKGVKKIDRTQVHSFKDWFFGLFRRHTKKNKKELIKVGGRNWMLNESKIIWMSECFRRSQVRTDRNFPSLLSTLYSSREGCRGWHENKSLIRFWFKCHWHLKLTWMLNCNDIMTSEFSTDLMTGWTLNSTSSNDRQLYRIVVFIIFKEELQVSNVIQDGRNEQKRMT